MRRIILTFVTLTAVALLSVSCSKTGDTSEKSPPPYDGPTEMKIKWPAGEKYYWQIDIEQESQMNNDGQASPSKQAMNTTQEFTISAAKELDHGEQELELEFLPTPAEASGGASRPDPGAFWKQMAGARLRYLTDASGKVKTVKGGEEIEERMMSNQPPQVRALFKVMFSQENWKLYCSFAELMPEGPVKIGDAWPVKAEIVSPIGALVLNSTYRFTQWETRNGYRCMKLEQTGDVIPKPVANSPMSLKVEDGRISGQTWFDPALGMIVDSIAEQTMTRRVAAQGKSLTMQSREKSTLQLLKITD
jgi:hypothetical protein